MNLFLFNWLFKRRSIAILFGWYTNHVFHYVFNNRTGNDEFWSSKDSLYWFLGTARHQVKKDEIEAAFSDDFIKYHLSMPGAVILVAGCGLMKETNYMIDQNLISPASIIGVDINKYIEKYSALAGSNIADVTYMAVSFEELIEKDIHLDILFLFGGVIEFFSPDQAVNLISWAYRNGCRSLLIFGEGRLNETRKELRGVLGHNIPGILKKTGFDPQNPSSTRHELFADGRVKYYFITCDANA